MTKVLSDVSDAVEEASVARTSALSVGSVGLQLNVPRPYRSMGTFVAMDAQLAPLLGENSRFTFGVALPAGVGVVISTALITAPLLVLLTRSRLMPVPPEALVE
jgi:hypothetical protein